MENPARSTHPLILVAAASVTIASLAAAAHFTGLLPGRTAEAPATPAAALTAPAPAAVQPAGLAKADTPAPAPEASRPAPKPRVQRQADEAPRPVKRADTDNTRRSDEDWRYQGGTQRVSANNAGIDVIPSSSVPDARPAPAPAAAATPPVCRECGTVESIREVAAKGEGSGLGAIAGGVLGGVLGNQVGRGTGKDLATIAGAVGGAFAGHEVEKNVRTNKQYQVEVRFDDGSVRTYTLANPAWRSGDRVRLSNGNLVAINYSDR